MSLDRQQLRDRFRVYNLHADYQPISLDRTVAMLGMMCCCAAAWGKLRSVPAELGWPQAVCSKVASRTPRAQN